MRVMEFLATILLFQSTALAQGPSPEVMRFIQEGERPVRRAPAGEPDFDRVIEPAGAAGLPCMVAGRLLHGILCEYAVRALRTIARENRNFCENFTNRVTDLGEGDLEDRSNPGIQQCRHVVNRMKELARRIRAGEMRPEGAFDAAAAVHSRFRTESRTWASVRARARAQCRTDAEKASLDQNFDALQACVRDMWPALREVSDAVHSRRQP